jgi:hypothetical protein
LEADLRKIHDFMRSQTHVLGDDHIHKLHDAQCLSLVARIGALPVLEVQEATQLTDVLGRGPWGHDHKTKIASAIADRLTQGSPGGSGSVHSHRRCMQDLGCFHEYLTQQTSTPSRTLRFRWLLSSPELRHDVSPSGCCCPTRKQLEP